MALDSERLALAREEIDRADAAGLLGVGRVVSFEEVRAHLPYVVACVKEGHRVHPPVTNIFPRVVAGADGGRVVDGVVVPGGTDITCVSYVVQRDGEVFGPDPEVFRPERWLVSGEDDGGRLAAMEGAMFAFGMGPRICAGKDLALLETYKVIAEVSPFSVSIFSSSLSFDDLLFKMISFFVSLRPRFMLAKR